MKQKVSHRGCMCKLSRDGYEFFADTGLVSPTISFELYADDRMWLTIAINANEGSSMDIRMCVKNAFDFDRMKRLRLGFHSMSFAATIPQPANLVEIANVARAMPSRISVFDFVHGICVRQVPVVL